MSLFGLCTKYQYSPPMHRSPPKTQPTMIPIVSPEALLFLFFGLLCFILVGAALDRGDGARVGANVGGCWTTRPEAVTPPTVALATALAPGTTCAAACKLDVNAPKQASKRASKRERKEGRKGSPAIN